MVSNNFIREFLNLDKIDNEFVIIQVDSLSFTYHSLMFINKPNINLYEIDKYCRNCVLLVDEELYPNSISPEYNDFIKVPNPKYKFCRLVDEFKFPSKLSRYHKYTTSKYSVDSRVKCKEFYIGDNAKFDDNIIIGGEDFSPVLGDNPGEIVQFPQLGGVKIGNNVTIKYNSMIGKGTFSYTEIGDNTMIDYGCQIGHNCIIGKSCIIAAGTIIGGSTIVGDNTVIGIGAKIRNGIKIGNNVSVGMGSIVIRDIPDNAVVVGNPARIIEHKSIFDKGGLK